MRQSRASINSELKEIKRFTAERTAAINYEKLICKQREVIDSLRCELLLLKSYISLQKVATPFQANCSDISINSTCTSLNQSQLKADWEQSAAHLAAKKYDKLIKSMAEILQIPTSGGLEDEQILENVQKLKESATRKQEPIFIERIKEIKVPITVEKTIEKVVQRVVEKIVYVDRPVQKIVEKIIQKPVFKQKIVQRFVERKQEEPQESPSTVLNKTFSEKNLKQKRNQDAGYDYRYEQRSKYEPYRKPEGGSHLIKKRVDHGKQYYRKDY